MNLELKQSEPGRPNLVWAQMNGGRWVPTPFRSIDRAQRFINGEVSEKRAFRRLTEEEE